MVRLQTRRIIVCEKICGKSNRLKFPKNLDFNAFECFFLPKVFYIFQNWTKINVQFWDFLKKPPEKTQKVTSEHNALNSVFRRFCLLR